jgi:hypothetical protein
MDFAIDIGSFALNYLVGWCAHSAAPGTYALIGNFAAATGGWRHAMPTGSPSDFGSRKIEVGSADE